MGSLKTEIHQVARPKGTRLREPKEMLMTGPQNAILFKNKKEQFYDYDSKRFTIRGTTAGQR